MHSSPSIRLIVLVSGVSILLAVMCGAWWLTAHLAEYRTTLDQSLDTLETTFVARAREADRTEVTLESSARVADCGSRPRFESLLSALSTLTPSERRELDVLFASCGDYFVDVKLYFIDELEVLATLYETTLTHRSLLLKPITLREQTASHMRTLIALERTRATLLHEQVALQGSVIDVLAGRMPMSGLTTLTEEGTALNARLGNTDAAIDQVRAALENIL